LEPCLGGQFGAVGGGQFDRILQLTEDEINTIEGNE
jgi:hypothetical protein